MKAIASKTAPYRIAIKNKYTMNEMVVSLVKGDVWDVHSRSIDGYNEKDYYVVSKDGVSIYAPKKRLEVYFDFIELPKKKSVGECIRDALKRSYNA